MKAVSLIYPDQIFKNNPVLSHNRDSVIIEDNLFFGCDIKRIYRYHKQKIVLHRASLKSFESYLKQKKFKVLYYQHVRNVSSDFYLKKLYNDGYRAFYVTRIIDKVLNERINNFCLNHKVNLEVLDTPMFITSPTLSSEVISNKKKPLMVNFYQRQRKELGILVDEKGSPTGGKWSFDVENRKKLPKNIEVPAEPEINSNIFVEEAINHVRANYGDYKGDCKNFIYPIDFVQASNWLDRFLFENFTNFGSYEDAIHSNYKFLWHSILSPLLNIGLITPWEVVEKSLMISVRNNVPINSVEGFIRQIIGWREFIFLMYERSSDEMISSNFWEFEKKAFPDAFINASTGILPFDNAINTVKNFAWCHHIERLMVLGNFMLITEMHPLFVYEFFMENFIDAYEWVMIPNVFGMSQFADGGTFTTKPYFSGSNYIKKMSNFKDGEWSKVWDGLFWRFISNNEKFFKGQYRLSMMTSTLKRMGNVKFLQHKNIADSFIENMYRS